MESVRASWYWLVAHWPEFLIAVAIIVAGRRMIAWLIKHLHDKDDNAVLAVLRGDDGIFGKLIPDISKEVAITEKKVLCSLLRLEAAGRVHARGSRDGQRWYFGPRITGNDFRFSIHGRRVD